MNKANVHVELLAKLEAERVQQANAALLSRDEATNEESRAENKYDTRGQEAAYLAEGQARLAKELEQAWTILRNFRFENFPPSAPIALGALVAAKIDEDSNESWYLLSPAAGGAELKIEGKTILVLSAASPLGRKLIGGRAGERFAFGSGRDAKTIEIVSVA